MAFDDGGAQGAVPFGEGSQVEGSLLVESFVDKFSMKIRVIRVENVSKNPASATCTSV